MSSETIGSGDLPMQKAMNSSSGKVHIDLGTDLSFSKNDPENPVNWSKLSMPLQIFPRFHRK